ncbi:MAG: DUF2225 domain-containing protein [Treponemataceae bacterium]|nr:DUF2225 domain-containing protein [Treponemataceae bacterium]
MAPKSSGTDKKLAISFYSKQKVHCPVCKKDFAKEELLSGGGRMIAGNLTDELRRNYEPSAKYGAVYPLLYSIGACPTCHVAMLWSDFNTLEDGGAINKLLETEAKRKKSVELIFPHYNLNQNRTLYDGAAAYYLALLTYEKMPLQFSPTIKRAQICLRLAWLCGDIEKECPGHNYDYIAAQFYRKALFFYQDALELEQNHVESIAGISNFGPDIDKNYGYDGVIYLCGLLEYKYGQTENIQERLKVLEQYKRSIARIFGLGKSSKNKPGPLLEHSRALYDKISALLAEANIISDDDEE